MALGNNKNLLGFVDLLTGFLASALVLMLIFSYSLHKSGDIAGGPRDFIFYQVEIEGADVDQLGIKVFVKPPNRDWIETKVDQQGQPILNEEDFLEVGTSKFYAWGPAQTFNENYGLVANKRTYNVYGVSVLNDPGKWEVGILYYDHKQLNDNSYADFSGSNYASLINRQYRVKHIINTRVTTNHVKTDRIALGSFSNTEIMLQTKTP